MWRRRTKDEIHSIDHYRNALETLHEMRGPTGSTSVRVLDPDEAKNLRQPSHLDSIRSSSNPPRIQPPAGAGEDIVFDDALPPLRPSYQHDHERGHKNPEWAMTRAQSRPPLQNRQWYVVGIASASVLVLLIVGVVIGKTSHSSSPVATTTSTTTHAKKHTKTTQPHVTTTTAPTTYAPQPGASASAATYLAPSSSYVLTVTTTGGPCWTVIQSLPGNTQISAGSVAPGSPQQTRITGGAQVTLGAPGYAAIKINGRSVTFPSGFQAPLVLTFQPATPPTTTTTLVPIGTTTTTVAPVTTTTRKP